MAEHTDKKIRTRLSPAIEAYEKFESGAYNPITDYREDVHFNLRNGLDVLIEEDGIHTTSPFKLLPKDICEWSAKHSTDVDDILQDYGAYQQYQIDELKHSARLQYELYNSVDGYDQSAFDKEFSGLDNLSLADAIITKCQDRIDYLRNTTAGIESYNEITFRRQNIFNIEFIKQNQTLNNVRLKLYSEDFALTNHITIVGSVWENGSDKNPYSRQQRQYTIGEALNLANNRSINLLPKEKRPLVLPNTTGNRVIGEITYGSWSGLQIFDIDLKFSPTFLASDLTAADARDILFNKLRHYPWLISINLSASGKAVHIWTKVSRMHDLYKDTEDNIEIHKFWYRMSYLQKFAAISYILNEFCECDIYNEYSKGIIDTALAKPQQGIALNHDPEAKFNDNFVDLYPPIFYHKPPVTGINTDDWLTNDVVLNQFTSWFTDHEIIGESLAQFGEVRHATELNIIADDTYDLDGVKPIDMQSLQKGDKYRTRYRVVNTVIAIYGDNAKSRRLIHHILQAKQNKNSGQIDAFIRSAIINKKTADAYMVRQLQKLGLKLSLTEDSEEALQERELTRAEYVLKHSNYLFNKITPNTIVQLADDEYLTAQKNRILQISCSHKLNLIESPPNTGKTTLFKELAKQYSICMVSPFTSTIEAKIVTDDSISELFDVYYGDKNISEIENRSGRSAVMTFDKFARMPKEHYRFFDFIVVDESHLLFTSSYRLGVVSQTVEKIREYLLNDAKSVNDAFGNLHNSFQNLLSGTDESDNNEYTKFIMMTGTVTCEADYFSHYNLLNYIKVEKQHPFKKHADFIFCKTRETKMILLYEEIAESIKSGKKVLHPTNQGDGYAKKVVAAVEHILEREVKWDYYKRANSDEEFLHKINTNSSTGDLELLFSTDYLSVGIDIEDLGDYSIVFNTDFTAEEIEQFNNRLRRTDIHCKIFCDVLTDDGFIQPGVLSTKQISYGVTSELTSVFNDERTISKLQRHIYDRQGYYVILGEMFSRYFSIDNFGRVKFIRAALEIEQFEKQYREIARGILYIKTSLDKKYQYTIDIISKDEKVSGVIDRFDEITKSAHKEYRIQKSNMYVDLLKFISDDVNLQILNSQKVEFVKSSYENPDGTPGLHIGYDSSTGTPVFTYHKQYKIVFEGAYKSAMRLCKFYTSDTIHAVIDQCMATKELVSYSELSRYIDLMKLVYDDKKHSLSYVTRDILKLMYTHVNPDDGAVKLERHEYNELKIALQEYALGEIEDITSARLQSEQRLEEVQRRVDKFITIFFKRKSTKNYVKLEFRKIYEFDSEYINERAKNDEIFNKIIMGIDINDSDIEESIPMQHIDAAASISIA